ncbi:DNA primase [Candidatus Woesebacteria bacterium]|nr:DNA primase [Candidatus Woesebacteria bacterium]
MQDNVTAIKDKIDIVDYIGQFVSLKKAGRNFKAVCPFHDEKTPSFVVSPERQIWRCFGACGEGGDLISFVMKWEGITFYEALKELAPIAGVQLSNVQFEDKQWKQKESLYTINEYTMKFYQYLLNETEKGKHAKQYLLDRGINDKIIKTFELGYAPASWHSLTKFLEKRKFTEPQIITAGVSIKSKNGRIYDRFRNRIIFPIRDARTNIIGFSGRLLKDDPKSPKYINSPETAVYQKRKSLFGIHLAKEAIRKQNNVYIAEGEFDMITPYQHGISNIVAIKGSALTQEQLQILKHYTQTITLALDTDAAGEEAVKRGVREAEALDFDIQVVQFSKGKDPDEAARNDLAQFKKELTNPQPLYDFLIDRVTAKYPEHSSLHKKRIGDEMAEYIKDIRNPIVQEHYVKRLARILDVTESTVKQLMYKKKKKKQVTIVHHRKKGSELTRYELLQKYLMSFLLQHARPASIDLAMQRLFDEEDFTIPALKRLYEVFHLYVSKQKTFDYRQFAKILPNELLSISDETFLFISGYPADKGTQTAKILYDVLVESSKYHSALYSKDTTAQGEKRYAFFKERLQKLITQGQEYVEKHLEN